MLSPPPSPSGPGHSEDVYRDQPLRAARQNVCGTRLNTAEERLLVDREADRHRDPS